jgi:DNA-binding CsgD family transcriptional regulator
LSAGGGLLERERELAALEGMVSAARAGDGRVSLIEGPAGIGKTRLLDACGEMAVESGFAPLRVRGDDLAMGASFAAVRELFAAHVDVGAVGARDGASRLAAPVFSAAPLDRVDPDRAAVVLHGLHWLVADLAAAAGPLALLVDDAHWLDAASARFVMYLARRLESLPVLLVVSVRQGERTPAAGVLEALSVIAGSVLHPAALSVPAAGLMVRGELGPRADEELCRSCHEATAGNPFYLRQLTAALAAADARPTAAVARRIGALGVQTIGRSVLASVARLGGDCQRLAEVLAVLAPGSPLRHAAALAALERASAEAAADALRAGGLFAAERGLSFAHPIVREAVAAQLPASRLAALHAKAARLLVSDGAPADQVASHLLAAEPFGEAWVVEALRAAASSALAQGAPEAAVAYLRRALEEPPAPELRLGVLVQLGVAETHLPAAHDFATLREALALAEDPRRRAEIALELATGLTAMMRNGDARVVLEGVLDSSADLESGLAWQLESLLIWNGMLDLSASDRVRARAAGHLARAKRGEVSDPVMLAALAGLEGIGGGTAAAAIGLIQRALAGGRIMESLAAFGGACMLLTYTDQLEDAAKVLDLAAAAAGQRGSAVVLRAIVALRATVAYRAGDIPLAEDQSRQALALALELGSKFLSVATFVEVLLELGRADEALKLLEPIELDERALHSFHGMTLLVARGRVNAALGEPAAALENLVEADRRMAAGGWNLSVIMSWAPTAAIALDQLGRSDEARALAARELDAAARFGTPRARGIALSLAGALDRGEQGLARLQEAAQVLEGSPARLEHARALVNLGAGLRALGHREQARAPLSKGLELAHRCGAAALVDRARAELRAAGARPRRNTLTGPDALTPAELRTARLAADGRTNREIAQALFVSTKTVEAQLSQAYAKLSIARREQLGGALAANR